MYLKELKQHIEQVIAHQKPKSFDDLFRLSKGAFPSVVYPLVSERKVSRSLKKNFYGLKDINNIIPESNPTNYDWRFDNQTIKKIVALTKKKKFKRIALFGTPSLFSPISKYVENTTLYDINQPLKAHFNEDKRVIITDLNEYNFENTSSFDCIIMDPPWYLNYYQTWLQKANLLLDIGGEIYTTLFQELLRPKAAKELSSIKALADKIGSHETIRDHIGYITPLFERELFNYQNIPCYGNWRIADLLIIKKEKNSILPIIKTNKKDTWTRLEIGTQTIAIDKGKNADLTISVSYPYKNNDSLIKSVSERDPIRKKLNFITSRNRGLIISGGNKIIQILKAIADGIPKKQILTNANLSEKEVVEMEKILDTIYI